VTHGLERALNEACDAAMSVAGLVHRDELRFLFLAAALPTAQGEVVEIGSYKGRSTIALCKGALWAGQTRVIACDPFTAASAAVSGVPANESFYDAFADSLKRHELWQNVEVHREPSAEMAKSWTRPIRLLWIDGDHRYTGVKADLESFLPHLAPGALVAFHDVGSAEFQGPAMCFADDILFSDGFGRCGLCHLIGWSQYVASGGREASPQAKMRVCRVLAARRLRQIFGKKVPWLARWQYRQYRRYSTGRDFEKWIRPVSPGHGGGLPP